MNTCWACGCENGGDQHDCVASLKAKLAERDAALAAARKTLAEAMGVIHGLHLAVTGESSGQYDNHDSLSRKMLAAVVELHQQLEAAQADVRRLDWILKMDDEEMNRESLDAAIESTEVKHG